MSTVFDLGMIKSIPASLAASQLQIAVETDPEILSIARANLDLDTAILALLQKHGAADVLGALAEAASIAGASTTNATVADLFEDVSAQIYAALETVADLEREAES